MAIEDFFDHRCDIFHITREAASPGYALPPSPDFKYSPEPDLTDVECHFGVKSATIRIEQKDPQNEMDSDIKLTLPAGTDIRLHDKVVSKESGLEYTAGLPRNIRGHHIAVKIRRVSQQKPL